MRVAVIQVTSGGIEIMGVISAWHPLSAVPGFQLNATRCLPAFVAGPPETGSLFKMTAVREPVARGPLGKQIGVVLARLNPHEDVTQDMKANY